MTLTSNKAVRMILEEEISGIEEDKDKLKDIQGGLQTMHEGHTDEL